MDKLFKKGERIRLKGQNIIGRIVRDQLWQGQILLIERETKSLDATEINHFECLPGEVEYCSK